MNNGLYKSQAIQNAPTIGLIPPYEYPAFRFLQGRGEIMLNSEDGPVTTLWEFLIHSRDSDYPLLLDGELFAKEDLLLIAADLLPQISDVIEHWVRKEGREKIIKMCQEIGIETES